MRGRQAGGPRDLRTVLFTDIVGSTEHAARVGDRAWGDLLARHHALVRTALRASGGREMDTAGDGFFATFARPTEALACAAAIVRGMGPLGLAVRVGLHAGEVETRDGKAGGITVHVAARLMAAAGPDEILASATVRDLAAGAGWTFTDRGPLELKGLAEPVHAYALDLAAAPTTLPRGQVGVGSTLRAVTPPRAIGAAAAVVGLVVVLLAAVALSGGGGAHPSPTPTAVAAASATPATTPSTSPSASASETSGPSGAAPLLPEITSTDGYALPIGTYEAQGLPATPTMTVDDPGWWVDGYYPGVLQLSRATSPSDTLAIYLLTTLATDPCAQNPETTIGPEPDKVFLAWARSNKALTVTPDTSRRFGNLATTEVDVSVVDKYACPYTDPISVAVTGYQLSWVHDKYVLTTQIMGQQRGLSFASGLRTRVEIAAVDGKLLLIVLETPTAAEFDSFRPLAEKILSTLKFTP